jgi:hypothetical protein
MTYMLGQALVGPVFFLHSMLVGAALLPWILGRSHAQDRPQPDRLLFWFWSACLGALVNTLMLVLLGLLGCFSTAPVSAGLAILTLLSVQMLRKHPASSTVPGEFRQVVGWFLFWCLPLALISLRAEGDWDDTMYHLPLARSYLSHGAIVLEPYLRFPLFPQHMNILFGVGLMYGGEIGAQSMASTPLALIALGLMGLSRWLSGSLLVGVVAGFAMFWTGPVATVLGYAYVDNGLALYCTAAASLLAWIAGNPPGKTGQGALLLLAGLFAGAAAGVKLFGLLFTAIVGLLVLAHYRNSKAVATYTLGVLIAGGVWYIRSALISGDPVHPAGGSIFGYYLWDAQDLLVQKQEQATHGVPVSSLNIWGALNKASSLLLAPALATLLLPRLSNALRTLRAIFVIYLISWFLISQVHRYLMPVLPIGLFLGAWLVGQAGCLYRKRGLAGPSWLKLDSAGWFLVVVACVGMTGVVTRFAPNISGSAESRQAALAQRPGYGLIAKANELIPTQGPRLLQVGFENGVYFFKGTVIGGVFGPGRYRQFGSCENDVCKIVSGQEMARLMRRFQANMLAVATTTFKLAKLPDDYPVYFEEVHADSFGVLLVLRTSS